MSENDAQQTMSSAEETAQAAIQVITSAGRNLAIFSHELPNSIYDHPDAIDALIQLANATQQAKVRVIVSRPQIATNNSPRFMELARRLQSVIELRTLAEELGHHEETYIVADESSVIYQPSESRWDASLNLTVPHLARRYLNSFNNLWERAEPDSEFRRLSI